MSDEKMSKAEISAMGGREAHRRGVAHEWTSEEARDAGRKGGLTVSSDRDHMAEIGRKGGETLARDREYMARIGRKGGEAVGRDAKHMAEIGRRGGVERARRRRGG